MLKFYFPVMMIILTGSQVAHFEKTCLYTFVFPTLDERYEIASTENSLVTIPFQLKSTNSSYLSSYENIKISIHENRETPYCYIMHAKDNCRGTPAVPGCKCLKAGEYELQKNVSMRDNGQWEWRAKGGTMTPLSQRVLFNITLPDPPQVLDFTLPGESDLQHNSMSRLTCIVDKGNPPATIRIFNAQNRQVSSCNRTVTGNPRIDMLTCTLRHLTCQTSNTYTCEAVGATTDTRGVYLTIKGPPELSGHAELQKTEKMPLRFRVCSYTDNFTECFFSRGSGSGTDRMVQTDQSRKIECASLGLKVDGNPPLLTMTVETKELREAGQTQWQLTLANKMGKTEKIFSLLATKETTDLSTDNPEDIKRETNTNQPETNFLLTDAGLITLASNGSVVVVIVLMVVAICVRRKGRRSRRVLLEDIWLHRRPVPRPPQQQPPSLPARHQLAPPPPPPPAVGLGGAVSLSDVTGARRQSDSSESIYDKPNDFGQHSGEGLSAADTRTRDAHADSPPEDYLTPRGQVKGATNQPSDYLHPTA